MSAMSKSDTAMIDFVDSIANAVRIKGEALL
jgi:hypothetical protein